LKPDRPAHAEAHHYRSRSGKNEPGMHTGGGVTVGVIFLAAAHFA
jgi:hypothetical protein